MGTKKSCGVMGLRNQPLVILNLEFYNLKTKCCTIKNYLNQQTFFFGRILSIHLIFLETLIHHNCYMYISILNYPYMSLSQQQKNLNAF